MKTKKIITGIIAIATTLSLIFVACNKKTPNITENNKTQATILSNEVVSRSNDDVVLYSKDSNNGDVYMMKIHTNSDGSVDVLREIVSDNGNVATAPHILMEEVQYSIVQNSLNVNFEDGKNYYIVPFNPICATNQLERQTGGGTTTYYCQSNCNSDVLTCSMLSTKGNDGYLSYSCSGTCNQCNLKTVSCPGSDVGSSNYSTVGTVVIEATTINYVN